MNPLDKGEHIAGREVDAVHFIQSGSCRPAQMWTQATSFVYTVHIIYKETRLMNDDLVTELTARNRIFVQHAFAPSDTMMPRLKAIVIGCADPRVDPAHVLGLADGDALIIRNVGGRYTPATLQTMATLRAVAQAEGGTTVAGWNLIVLHHTDCGITRLADNSDILAPMFGIEPADLSTKAIGDPHQAIAVDVAAIKANPFLLAEFIVSGLVYDVHSGLVETVVPPSQLRESSVALAATSS
jgi:carbonic anhydrase